MSNSNTNAIAIFGYNNTRLYDVENIKKLARKRFQAELILIKEGVTDADFAVTPYCIDAKPESPDVAATLKYYVAKMNLNLLGCLPFSDKGVVGAAYAAKNLGLFHDDENTASAMLDKKLFRELEKSFEVSPAAYKKPFYAQAFSADDLLANLESCGKYFIKPSAEGNSRGCMKIESRSDLLIWLESNAQYLKHGVMCEEYLSSGREYSFDGLNSNYWITEKFTTDGAYRAEYQHIVPAPLTSALKNKISDTLKELLSHLGSSGGAFHHEFFILKNNQIASVEPNRRPAGMWIWDLASWSFENFNAWEQWLDLCCGKKPEPVNLIKANYSGVRAVLAKNKSRIASIDDKKIAEDFKNNFGDEKYRFMIFKKPGDNVVAEPRDNSDFLAFVATRDKNYNHLLKRLILAEEIILNNIKFEGAI